MSGPTVPDVLRAMADSASEQGNAIWSSAEEAAAAFRIGLAQCVATLRMAAAAWPEHRPTFLAERNSYLLAAAHLVSQRWRDEPEDEGRVYVRNGWPDLAEALDALAAAVPGPAGEKP